MSFHLSMGAINKATNKYERPKWADKKDHFMCPECKSDLTLRQGEVNRAHFAHKRSDHPCRYYERPGEAQIHKDSKCAMKAIMER